MTVTDCEPNIPRKIFIKNIKKKLVSGCELKFGCNPPNLKALIGHKFSDVTARDPELPLCLVKNESNLHSRPMTKSFLPLENP